MFASKYRLAALPLRALDAVGLVPAPRVPVAFVVERANWSTRWDGTYICREVEKIAPGTAEVVDRPERQARRIVHFGSQFQWCAWADSLPRSNRYVVTFFHGKREDDAEMARHVDAFLATVPRIDIVVTAARLIENRLLDWGVPREKLVRIPIGVDTVSFRPSSDEERRAARRRYGIPDDAIVIGSFQKDGVGWREGDEPKLIKGPDILVDVARHVARERKVFVLLTGPARGYVKRGLSDAGIAFAHEHLDDYRDLPRCFAALDVYLNPSREEGGPKGILEAMSAGVPVVSTRVGMAEDVIRHGANGHLADVGDSAALAAAVLDGASDGSGRDERVAAARADIAACDWSNVGRMHYETVYRPVLRRAASP